MVWRFDKVFPPQNFRVCEGSWEFWGFLKGFSRDFKDFQGFSRIVKGFQAMLRDFIRDSDTQRLKRDSKETQKRLRDWKVTQRLQKDSICPNISFKLLHRSMTHSGYASRWYTTHSRVCSIQTTKKYLKNATEHKLALNRSRKKAGQVFSSMDSSHS